MAGCSQHPEPVRPARWRLPTWTPAPRAYRVIWLVLLLMLLLPGIRLILLTFQEQLGANPVEFLSRATGYWALVALCLTLAVTPLRRLTGWNWLIRLRRTLGLTAFAYGTVHLLCYLVLDFGLDFGSILRDLVKRPFITFGMLTFMLMVPLALTSNQRAIRWLGGRRWQMLHRLIYLMAMTAVVHFWLHRSGKNDVDEPGVFAVVIAILLGARWFFWKANGRL